MNRLLIARFVSVLVGAAVLFGVAARPRRRFLYRLPGRDRRLPRRQGRARPVDRRRQAELTLITSAGATPNTAGSRVRHNRPAAVRT